MKVNKPNMNEVTGAPLKKTERSIVTGEASKSAASKDHPVLKDKVAISSQGGQLAAFHAQYTTLPDGTADRIQSLKEAIESGQYRPKADEIAEALVANFES